LNIGLWYEEWLTFAGQQKTPSNNINYADLINIDFITLDIKHVDLFNQPLNALTIEANNESKKWHVDINSDNLKTTIEHRAGIPSRIDFNIDKLNFKQIDLSQLYDDDSEKLMDKQQVSRNLREDYPEIFIECKQCIYKNNDLSPLSVHVFPSKDRLNIRSIKIVGNDDKIQMSGTWDQKNTNIIVDIEAGKDNELLKRFGFASPVIYRKGTVTGAFDWKGAPWQFNFESLNGSFSAALANGLITEVNDKGARLLSIFSLDGIRRSLNLEFDNVFSKGLNFDDLTLSGNISNGIIKNDNFYLDGSVGKIVGRGQIDLSNYDTNYQFSYSPAVTSSLAVLTAFAINPLTGAAVLVLSKIFEPVVETIIRVDFTVKGPIDDPEVKLVTQKRGKVKLQNSEVLEEIEKKSDK
jgi:uncharacterized protein YhdP